MLSSLWLWAIAWQHVWHADRLATSLGLVRVSGEVATWWPLVALLIGIIFAGLGVLLMIPKAGSKVRWLLWLPIVVTFVEAWCHRGAFGCVLLSLQISTLVVAAMGSLLSSRVQWYFLILTVGLCFASHGLMAANVLPIPERYLDMTERGFGVDRSWAVTIMWWAGVLDVALAVALLIPLRGVFQAALAWASVWGALTVLARLFAVGDWSEPVVHLDRWGWEFIRRLPHAVVPALLLFESWSSCRARETAVSNVAGVG